MIRFKDFLREATDEENVIGDDGEPEKFTQGLYRNSAKPPFRLGKVTSQGKVHKIERLGPFLHRITFKDMKKEDKKSALDKDKARKLLFKEPATKKPAPKKTPAKKTTKTPAKKPAKKK